MAVRDWISKHPAWRCHTIFFYREEILLRIPARVGTRAGRCRPSKYPLKPHAAPPRPPLAARRRDISRPRYAAAGACKARRGVKGGGHPRRPARSSARGRPGLLRRMASSAEASLTRSADSFSSTTGSQEEIASHVSLPAMALTTAGRERSSPMTSTTLRRSGCAHLQRVLGRLIEAVVAVVAASVGLPPGDPTQITPAASASRSGGHVYIHTHTHTHTHAPVTRRAPAS